ncbi:tRNA pseudouridine(13) synthase TruD [Candidatus Woesearchaeota archaeon]|nr:tRNA pseudouridine(13) synthase TruD [Candidatus Woesearchaeota archaeon]
MYTIKQLPEDFLVREISTVQIKPSGRYLYFRLQKRHRNTLDVIRELARIFHIKEKQIGFAGNKDKTAVTEQLCSISDIGKERLSSITIKDVTLTIVGYGDEPISLGDLAGNEFEITVRNLDDLDTDGDIKPTHYLPNYFDEQRFSTNNISVGKNIIQKQFMGAVAIINHPLSHEYLQRHPADYVGALKKIPLRLLRLYVNAYQSYLWNETLAAFLEKYGTAPKKITNSHGSLVFVDDTEKFKDLEIPLIGFTTINTIPEIQAIINTIVTKENITYSDFIIKAIPEISAEGELRPAFVEVTDLKIGNLEDDDLHHGKKKIRVSFTLPKGSYATMLIKDLLNHQN